MEVGASSPQLLLLTVDSKVGDGSNGFNLYAHRRSFGQCNERLQATCLGNQRLVLSCSVARTGGGWRGFMHERSVM